MKGKKMLVKVYSVRDTKIGSYGTPFYAKGDIDAQRSFYVAVNDSQTQISNFPEDFELRFLGDFNPETGKFDLKEEPVFMVNAINLKKENLKPTGNAKQENPK